MLEALLGGGLGGFIAASAAHRVTAFIDRGAADRKSVV